MERVGPRHPAAVTAVVLLALAATAPVLPRLVWGPVAAVVLLGLAAWTGLSAADLGLGRTALRRGALAAAICTAVVTHAYVVAATVPALRPAFLDGRYRLDTGSAVLTAFVLIPLGTVLPEELAFRGVLWARLRDRWSTAGATVVSSLLFGLWHVVPSLGLTRHNPLLGALFGTGRGGQALTVAGAVLFTAAAAALLCELRRRTHSLLAPVGLHWAVNAIGVLVSASIG